MFEEDNSEMGQNLLGIETMKAVMDERSNLEKPIFRWNTDSRCQGVDRGGVSLEESFVPQAGLRTGSRGAVRRRVNWYAYVPGEPLREE